VSTSPDTSVPPTIEQQLLAAQELVARLTAANTELTRQLADADARNKKLKRNSRNDESSLRAQLAAAQSRRG
jgi:hypothetical protein